MKDQFEAVLTGSDSPIDGIVNKIYYDGHGEAYEFRSLDETLHLVIAKDDRGKWSRITGTDPYLSGWVDDLAQQIEHQAVKQ